MHNAPHCLLCDKISGISKVTRTKVIILQETYFNNYPFKDEAQTALFKDPARTVQ
jgi:hypothetical protein